MKCQACGTEQDAPPWPTAAVWGASNYINTGCKKCGCQTFVGWFEFTAGIPEPTYTGEEMREYARSAIAAHSSRRQRNK